MFSKKEVKEIIISIFILGFIFGFNDKRELFNFWHWSYNLFLMIMLCGITLLAIILVFKVIAKKRDCFAEYEIWRIKRISLMSKLKGGIPLGIIGGIIITFISLGKIYFPLVGSFKIKELKHRRIGRKFVNLGEFEEGLINLSWPLTNLFLFLIANIFGSFGLNLAMFKTINIWMALFYMLPVSNLSGAKIFFGSRYLYFFTFAFIILCLIFKNYVWLNIFISILIASVLLFIYYYAEKYVEKIKEK